MVTDCRYATLEEQKRIVAPVDGVVRIRPRFLPTLGTEY
jgi:hypothetical protein